MIPFTALLKMLFDVVMGHRTISWVEGLLGGVVAITAVLLYHFLKFDITKYLPIFSSLLSGDPKTILQKTAACKCPTLGEQGLSVLTDNIGLASILTLAAIVAVVTSYWNQLLAAVKSSRRFTVSLEIRQPTTLFNDVLDWVRAHQDQQDEPQHVSLREQTGQALMTYKNTVLQYIFVPAAGVTHFLYKGKYFDLERREAQNKVLTTDAYGRAVGQEVLVISTWGRDTSVFQDLLAEVKLLKDRNSVHVTYIYNAYVQSHTWTVRGRARSGRASGPLAFPNNIWES